MIPMADCWRCAVRWCWGKSLGYVRGGDGGEAQSLCVPCGVLGLMKQCAERGVRWYDMGGVDPVNNRGVYDFKKGTGARALEYLGEWEWSTSKALGWGVSRLIALQENGG